MTLSRIQFSYDKNSVELGRAYKKQFLDLKYQQSISVGDVPTIQQATQSIRYSLGFANVPPPQSPPMYRLAGLISSSPGSDLGKSSKSRVGPGRYFQTVSTFISAVMRKKFTLKKFFLIAPKWQWQKLYNLQFFITLKKNKFTWNNIFSQLKYMKFELFLSPVRPEVPPVSLSDFLPDSVGTRTLILRPGTRTTRYMSRAGRVGLSARANTTSEF